MDRFEVIAVFAVFAVVVMTFAAVVLIATPPQPACTTDTECMRMHCN